MYTAKKIYQKQIIFDGNSLSNNSGGNVVNGWRYVRTFYSSLINNKSPMQNYSIAGRRTSQLISEFTTKIGNFSKPGDILIMMEITNESRDGLSASTMYSNYKTYASLARSYGLKVIMCTCPSGKLTTDPSDTITRQQACNALILADNNTSWDATIDVGNIEHLNSEASITDTIYYNADQLHLTDTGYDLISAAATPIIQSFL